MISGIYTITSPSGNLYVGSACRFSSRWNRHLNDLRKGKHHSPQLQRAFDKYGESGLVFSKLLICSKEDLLFYEQRALDILKPKYNVFKTAGSPLGMKRSLEAIEKTASKNRGRKHSPEACKQRSESLKGRQFSDLAKANNPAIRKGRVQTLEHRQKNSEANKGRKLTEVAKQHISLSKMRPVRCVETGQIFDSGKAAGDWCREQGLTKNFKNKGVINFAIRTDIRAYGYRWIEV